MKAFGIARKMIIDVRHKRKLNFDEFASEIVAGRQNLLFFGEQHGQSQILEMQLNLLKRLRNEGSGKVKVIMEHFAIDQQRLLDTDQLDLHEYHQEDEGHDLEPYLPLLNFAKDNNIPVKAGFVPRRFAKMMVKEGQDETLNAVEKAGFMKRAEFIPGSDAHYSHFESLIVGENATSGRFRHIFPAQVLKDSVMASFIRREIEEETKLLILLGSGHCEFGFGVPERVGESHPSIIITCKLVPEDEMRFQDDNGRKIADFVLYYQPDT